MHGPSPEMRPATTPPAVGHYAPPPAGRAALCAAARTFADELRARPDRSAIRLASLARRLDAIAGDGAAEEVTWRDAIGARVTTDDVWTLAAEVGALRPIVEDWRDVPEAATLQALLGARLDQAERGRRLVLDLLAYGREPAPRAPLAPLPPRPPAVG